MVLNIKKLKLITSHHLSEDYKGYEYYDTKEKIKVIVKGRCKAEVILLLINRFGKERISELLRGQDNYCKLFRGRDRVIKPEIKVSETLIPTEDYFHEKSRNFGFDSFSSSRRMSISQEILNDKRIVDKIKAQKKLKKVERKDISELVSKELRKRWDRLSEYEKYKWSVK